MTIPSREQEEAFHAGMEAAYSNLTAILDRLHAAEMCLSMVVGGATIESYVGAELPTGRPYANFTADRMDELLGAVEEWCNDHLPTGHEVAL